MEKVQNLKSNNTAPLSKTFRDELLKYVYQFEVWTELDNIVYRCTLVQIYILYIFQ
jgi:hypothetical protein